MKLWRIQLKYYLLYHCAFSLFQFLVNFRKIHISVYVSHFLKVGSAHRKPETQIIAPQYQEVRRSKKNGLFWYQKVLWWSWSDLRASIPQWSHIPSGTQSNEKIWEDSKKIKNPRNSDLFRNKNESRKYKNKSTALIRGRVRHERVNLPGMVNGHGSKECKKHTCKERT